MRFRVDARKVRGVVMKDGTRYEVGRNGTVQIDEPRHLRELRKSPARGGNLEVQIEPPTLIVPGAEGRDCEKCGFSAWGWQRTCPRCGTALAE